MDSGTIIMYIVQMVVTLAIAVMGWGIKSAVNDMKSQITKNAADIEGVKKEFNDLKSDLPLVYVLREDFVRTMNGVDKHIGDLSNKVDNRVGEISGKLDRLLISLQKEG